MGPKAVTIWKMEQASNFTKIFHCRESSVARLKQEVVLNIVVKFHVGKSPFHSTTSDLNTVRGQPLLAFFFFFSGERVVDKQILFQKTIAGVSFYMVHRHNINATLVDLRPGNWSGSRP